MRTKQSFAAVACACYLSWLAFRCSHDQRQGDLYRHTSEAEDDRHVEGAELRKAARDSDHHGDGRHRSQQCPRQT